VGTVDTWQPGSAEGAGGPLVYPGEALSRSFARERVGRRSQARRFDREGSGQWTQAARQRYRYDGANQRTVKQTIDPTYNTGNNNRGLTLKNSKENIALYVYGGDYERRGLARNGPTNNVVYVAKNQTETQFMVGGARVVQKSPGAFATGVLDPDDRVTVAITDLIGSTSAVIDLVSGALVETSTYYPNGARETYRAPDTENVAAEPMGFTGKEADEEVGVTYFGERYLIPRIGRWATPDPLSIHAAGGGESLNSYHYVSGNLLQARDPNGLKVVGPQPTVQEQLVSEGAAQTMQDALEADDNNGDQDVTGVFHFDDADVVTGTPDNVRGAIMDDGSIGQVTTVEAARQQVEADALAMRRIETTVAIGTMGSVAGLGLITATMTEGMAAGATFSFGGTILSLDGDLDSAMSAGVGGGMAGMLTPLTGGGMQLEVAQNFLVAGLGLAIEEHLNGTSENIGSLAFCSKAAAGSALGVGLKLFLGLSPAAADTVESMVVPAGGVLGEVIDPLIDDTLGGSSSDGPPSDLGISEGDRAEDVP